MVDSYKHDVSGVHNILSELRVIRENYNTKINDLKALIDEINASNSWIDINVKDSFINTCNSYLTLYKEHSDKMELYEKYLSAKSGEMNDVEEKHTLEGSKYE